MKINRLLSSLLVFLVAISPTYGTNYNLKFYPDPVSDTFFRGPTLSSKQTRLPLGTIIESREGATNFSPGATVKQLAFVSSNTFGNKIRATATLILPPTFNEHSGILAYPAWNDSAGRQCSLGYFHGSHDPDRLTAALFSNVSEAGTEIYGAAKLNDMGILIPDGNGANMAFGANVLSGHITLDAIRATKNFKGIANTNFANRKFAVFGYSGGGMMSAWTAVMEPTYAKDLRKNIVEYVAGGTPVDFVDLAEKYNFFNNQPKEEFGIAAALMLGLTREYTDFNIGEKLNKLGNKMFIASRNDCLTDIITRFQDFSGGRILKSTQRNYFAEIIKIAKENSLTDYRGKLPIKPIHFWHADNDTEIPQAKLVKQIVARWKAAGVNVDFTLMSGDHKTLGFAVIPKTIDYFADKVRN